LDSLVDGGANAIDGLLSDALTDGGDLGDERAAEGLNGGLLLLEVLEDDFGDAELVKVGLLGNDVVDQGAGRGLELGGEILEAKSFLELQRLGGPDV